MNAKRITTFIILLILCFSLGISSLAWDGDDLLLAGVNMSLSHLSDETSSLSNNAFEKYIEAGIFDKSSGTACSTLYRNAMSNGSFTTVENFLARNSIECSEAAKYKESNKTYSQYAANGLRQHDKTDGRLNAAMDKFNENAHFVYTFLTGFGCLTSLLVFIIIFMRITWLPEHATQRRKAMEDIVTAGVAVILLGGFWLVIGVFQSMFDRFWESYTVYSKDWITAGNVFLVEYKSLIVGILGVATLTAFLMFIKAVTAVALGEDNPHQKTSKMQQVLYCGLASAGLGAITLFTGFFWNMLG